MSPYAEPGGYINFMQDDDYDKIQDNEVVPTLVEFEVAVPRPRPAVR